MHGGIRAGEAGNEIQVDKLNEEAWDNRISNTQLALELAKEAGDLSGKLSYTHGIAYSMQTLAVCYQLLSQYEISLGYCLDALPLFEFLCEEKGIASIYSCIGTDYFNLGDFEKSLRNHFTALKLREQLKSDADRSSSYFNIANVYSATGDYEMALAYYIRSEKIAKTLSDKSIWSKVLNGIGGLHMMRLDFEKAIECYIQSVQVKKEIGDFRSTASTLYNMGNCYIDLQDFNNAHECLRESKKIAVEFGDRKTEGSCMQAFGRLFLVQKKLPEAIDCLNRALFIFSDLKAKKEKAECHHYLHDAYHRLLNYEVALNHLQEHYKIKEEITGQEWSKKIERLTTLHEMDAMRKESEIEQLKNVELKKANQLIEDKNRNILDSIEYARYIQHILLPREEHIKQSFRESFVFYRPKDIVSGDFFLHYRVENTVLLAVADCTGHGVPGAFMTLAGNNMIEHIVKVEKIMEPALILKALNNAIAEMFERENDRLTLKSGMDIAFCAINLSNLQMHFAGAHNPVYIVREGLLTEHKADRVTLGYRMNPDFTQHVFQLHKQDMVYLFSDGFADQKGGAGKTKFYYPPFKALLSGLSNSEMTEQVNELDKTLACWKNDNPQIDDITILGIRI